MSFFKRHIVKPKIPKINLGQNLTHVKDTFLDFLPFLKKKFLTLYFLQQTSIFALTHFTSQGFIAPILDMEF